MGGARWKSSEVREKQGEIKPSKASEPSDKEKISAEAEEKREALSAITINDKARLVEYEKQKGTGANADFFTDYVFDKTGQKWRIDIRKVD